MSSSIELQLKTLQVLRSCMHGRPKPRPKKVSFRDEQTQQPLPAIANNTKQVKKVSYIGLTEKDLQEEELPEPNSNSRVLKSCLKVKSKGKRILPRTHKRVSFNTKEIALFAKGLSLEEQQFEKSVEVLEPVKNKRKRFLRLRKMWNSIRRNN